jgi:curved DNA-binding protein
VKGAPGKKNDSKIKLRGKGFTIYKKDDQHGDLYVTFKIKVPAGLSDEEKKLFTELAKLRGHGK